MGKAFVVGTCAFVYQPDLFMFFSDFFSDKHLDLTCCAKLGTHAHPPKNDELMILVP
jgi:hypothetical protein